MIITLQLLSFLDTNSDERKYLRVRYQGKKPPNLVEDWGRKPLGINWTKNFSIYKGRIDRKILNIRYMKKLLNLHRKKEEKYSHWIMNSNVLIQRGQLGKNFPYMEVKRLEFRRVSWLDCSKKQFRYNSKLGYFEEFA